MLRVDPSIICHKLSIHPQAKLVKHKSLKMNAKHLWALSDEVDRLLNAGFILETFYPDWLTNPILIEKKNEKWRVCIDFMDLNNTCPKDSFPLPSINQMTDATTGS